ncbi:MAG: hypothetical protein ACJA1W_002818 [Akkermansiaceae bacterium]|jgi:hypothetical protein
MRNAAGNHNGGDISLSGIEEGPSQKSTPYGVESENGNRVFFERKTHRPAHN